MSKTILELAQEKQDEIASQDAKSEIIDLSIQGMKQVNKMKMHHLFGEIIKLAAKL